MVKKCSLWLPNPYRVCDGNPTHALVDIFGLGPPSMSSGYGIINSSYYQQSNSRLARLRV